MGKRLTIGMTGVLLATAGPMVPVAPVAAQARGDTTLAANRVTATTLGGSVTTRTFRLRMERGSSVIIDLVPAGVSDDSTATDESAQSLMSNSSPGTAPAQLGLTVVGPNGATVRRVGVGASMAGGPNSDSPEAGVGDGGVRAAIYATATGDYVVTARNESQTALPVELIVRPRRLPAPPVAVAIGTAADQTATLAPGARGLFQFTTTKPDQMVTIDVTSEVFDTVVELHGPGGGIDGPMVGQDDDGGDGNNARLTTTLTEPGTYSIVTRAYTGSGAYRVKLVTTDAVRIAPVALTVGTPVEGRFAGGDFMVTTGDAAEAYQPYRLTGRAGQRVAIGMEAVGRREAQDSAFDPILQVVGDAPVAVDASGTGATDAAVIAENDDDVGYNAKVHIRFVRDGSVLVRAGTRGNTSPRGQYRLTVTDESTASR